MQTSYPTSPILLVGHRGTGKTTLGPLLSERLGDAWNFVDLDAEIERSTGQTPAELIAEDEANFRRVESAQLLRLLGDSCGQSVIALGAGCQLPTPKKLAVTPLYIWLWRDGWADEARAGRARLRDELSFADEVRWMRQSREPAWASVAHLFFRIPRARSPQLVARMLADYSRWAFDSPNSATAKRSWLVPETMEQLPRASRDARLFGLAGVEVRSDLCPDFATYLTNANEDEKPRVLASLRTPAPEWLEAAGAQALTHTLDIDLDYLDVVRDAGTLEQLAPRPLLLSTHPPGIGEGSAEKLVQSAERLRAAYPQWADYIELKYAPTPSSFAALRRCFEIAKELKQSGYPTTFLPQGARFRWTRPILANPANGGELVNAQNYLPVGICHTRLPSSFINPPADAPLSDAPSPMDLQGWLPHFARLAAPDAQNQREYFDGLIGDPVDASIGDWWHTQAAIERKSPTRYLKIRIGRDDDDRALDDAFELFEALGLRGLSVTAPLKRRMKRIVIDSKESGLQTPLNTLRRTPDGWVGCDTDAIGMRATLRAIMHEDGSKREVGEPNKTVSIIGRGGVSPAILRAVDEAGWTVREHASAREGWKLSQTEVAAKNVQLVINAAGPRQNIAKNAPTCDIWLDLHYNSLAPKPACARSHRNGDVFFKAQAQAQRVFWNKARD